METITSSSLYEAKEYTPRPGMKYEIAEGIVVEMREPSPAIVEQMDRISKRIRGAGKDDDERNAAMQDPDSDVYYVKVLVERAKLAVRSPESFQWEPTSIRMKVLRQIAEDFQTL